MPDTRQPDAMITTEWRVVEADGQPYPPHAAPLQTREQAERRVEFYNSLTRATGEGRLPKRPVRMERRVVVWSPWEDGDAGFSLPMGSMPAGRGTDA